MSSNDNAIKVSNLSKCYQIYDTPRDRLWQFVAPRIQGLVGQKKRQYFREFWALKDFSFEVKKGETVGIVGRNGSGKSTLLQLICGTATPTTGVVNTRGRVAALLELGAGFNPEFTGRENVLLNAAIFGVPREEMEARMGDVLAFSELGDFLDQPVKTYSSGMYSRLGFSTAIHVDPEILIVDEALAVGDSRFVAKCMRRIKDIQDQGATILFVSHDVGTVRTLCERAVWLDKGRLVEQGDVFPVTGRYMEYMYKDENTPCDQVASQSQEVPAESDTLPAVAQGEAVSASLSNTETLEKPIVAFDGRPVTHWGSHKGMILSAAILDERGGRKDVYAWGEVINIVIEVHVPMSVSRENLSVACSIKDLKGTDLIVSTTLDFESRRFPDKERLKVSFRLTNFLVTGKYLLVAAIENRQNHDVHYYEYLEGAHYFTSLSDKRFFGIFQPKIEQEFQA